MSIHWENWSGSLSFKAHRLLRPSCEEEVLEIIRSSVKKNRTLRITGASHSSTPLFKTDDTLLTLEKMTGVLSHDEKLSQARCYPGTKILDLGKELQKRNLSFHNLGDVALQHIAGAIGTGTHGTGIKLGNLSTMLCGGRMINGRGEVITFDENDLAFLAGARVSLGLLGIFTEMNLSLMPLYQLERKEWFVPFKDFIDHVDELVVKNRHFDFYWYPRNDLVKIRTMNNPDEGYMPITQAQLDEVHRDFAQNVLHKHTEMTNKFEEMEYELPFEEGIPCFLKVRQRVLKKWRQYVGWRLLFRTIKEDDSYLSPAYGRKTISISLHQNSSLPYQDTSVTSNPSLETITVAPSAKKHFLKKNELRLLYPKWDHFLQLREKHDPQGIFLNSYFKEIFT